MKPSGMKTLSVKSRRAHAVDLTIAVLARAQLEKSIRDAEKIRREIAILIEKQRAR